MKEPQLHAYSTIGTVLATAGVVIAVYFADEAAGSTGAAADPYENMVVIDAALAEKSTAEKKQPQKEFRPPPEPVKPVGVSHDENAKPVVEPDKPKPDPKVDVQSVLDKNRAKEEDEDLPVGKPEIETGRVDGVEIGYGDKTYGDPFLGALKSGVMRAWEFPEILSDVGTPLGCIQLKADGTIEDIEVKKPSGNAELDDSVERALTALQKSINQEPKPLPAKLEYLTRMQLCWRMKV